jgi:hypothetical protein
MSTIISNKTIVEDEGFTVAAKDVINFVGNGVTVTNVAGKATVNIPGNPASGNYGLYAQTEQSVPITDDSAHTIIGSGVGTLSVPENGFQVGDSFNAEFGGILSCKNGETISIRILSGTNTLSLSPVFTMPSSGVNNQVWTMSVNFTVRAIGAAGTASIVVIANFHVLKLASGTQEGFGWRTINQSTFDTTVSNQLEIAARWGSNTPAQNSIYSDVFVLHKTY